MAKWETVCEDNSAEKNRIIFKVCCKVVVGGGNQTWDSERQEGSGAIRAPHPLTSPGAQYGSQPHTNPPRSLLSAFLVPRLHLSMGRGPEHGRHPQNKVLMEERQSPISEMQMVRSKMQLHRQTFLPLPPLLPPPLCV